MTDETQPFWTNPASTTEEYTRPPKPTWRQTGEHQINRVRHIYDAGWLTALGWTIVLLWLINTYHR